MNNAAITGVCIYASTIQFSNEKPDSEKGTAVI